MTSSAGHSTSVPPGRSGAGGSREQPARPVSSPVDPVTGRVRLPPECATADELWGWIEAVTPHIEALNQAADEAEAALAELNLTGTQSRIFRVLFRAHGRVVNKAFLEEEVWRGAAHSENLFEVTLCKMRRRLAGSGYRIETVWGQGVVLHKDSSP